MLRGSPPHRQDYRGFREVPSPIEPALRLSLLYVLSQLPVPDRRKPGEGRPGGPWGKGPKDPNDAA
jgi:hypothetical protein